ncbi:hypothetical protein Avbf_13041 [Armadillidium vulgare]|nr:hypothetical protein Avbf_13041 [Armadillidium vulgare]
MLQKFFLISSYGCLITVFDRFSPSSSYTNNNSCVSYLDLSLHIEKLELIQNLIIINKIIMKIEIKLLVLISLSKIPRLTKYGSTSSMESFPNTGGARTGSERGSMESLTRGVPPKIPSMFEECFEPHWKTRR